MRPSSVSGPSDTASARPRTARARPGMSRASRALTSAADRPAVSREAAASSAWPLAACATPVAALMATFMTASRVFGSGRVAMGSSSASSIGGSKRGPRSGSVSSATNQPRAPAVVLTRSCRSSRAPASSSDPPQRRTSLANRAPISWASSKEAPRFFRRRAADGLSFFWEWRPFCSRAYSSSFARIFASSSISLVERTGLGARAPRGRMRSVTVATSDASRSATRIIAAISFGRYVGWERRISPWKKSCKKCGDTSDAAWRLRCLPARSAGAVNFTGIWG
mmetsp:Transcript_22909/g.68771  ORF Transcript_22909/g.68771 Transcript_22909/m.68771 type:complete len:281 (+) Transcript_22909:211-1053(+)